MDKYLTLDLEIKEGQIEDGARTILQHIRPDWKPENIQFKYFTEGISNTLLGCYLEGSENDMVLVRIYGPKTEIMIDRDAELVNILHLGKHQLAAPLYCAFSNGLAYSFIPGKPLDEVSIRDPEIVALMVKELVRLHSVPPVQSEETRVEYDAKLTTILNSLPESFSDTATQKRFTERVPPKSALVEEGQMLCKTLASLGSPLVFTHNDLLLQNIIYDKDRKKISFIDFEYAGISYQAYDIGNHFCEHAGVGEVDFSRYPDRTHQLSWLRQYLQEWYKATGRGDQEVSSTDLDRLYVQVNKCALAGHFFWGVWALIQAKNSKIDFDFMGYSILKLDEYFRRKDEFLALKSPE